MKKNELIELLSQMKGNPDVVVWNGFVEDWMPLGKPEKASLVQQSKKKSLHFHNLRRINKGLEPETDASKMAPSEWTFGERKLEGVEIYDKKKNVIMLVMRKRGISTFDRMGDIEY